MPAHNPWKPEEDSALADALLAGRTRLDIAYSGLLPGRTDNAIMTRLNVIRRRQRMFGDGPT